MKGKKTTYIDGAKEIVKILERNNFEIAFGIITSIKNRKESNIAVKFKDLKSCIFLTIITKRYKQEIRIYGEKDIEKVKKVLEENLRLEKYIFLK